MTIIIRDESGNEEILPKPIGEKWGIWDIILASILLFLLLVFPFLFFAKVFNSLLFWILSISFPALLIYYMFFVGSNITNIIFDMKNKVVIIEQRRIINKKIKSKEIEKIRFSDIKRIAIIKEKELSETKRFFINISTYGKYARIYSTNDQSDAEILAEKISKITNKEILRGNVYVIPADEVWSY